VPIRPGAAIRAAAPALAAYLLLRAFGVAVLALFAHRFERDLWELLGRFDGTWYVRIAEHGYDGAIPIDPDGGYATTDLAFFPLYPGLIALFDPVLPGGARAAALAVSWVAGLAAAWGLFAIGAHLRGRRTGVLLVALWAVLPHAVVQSMAYTESLFTALAAWSLYALLCGRWLTAGGLCLVAGLVRPTAGALVLAVGLAALAAVLRRRDGWRPWVAGLLAPLGLLGYLGWVAQRLGRLDGYLHVQAAAWGMRFDGGRDTYRNIRAILTTPTHPLSRYVVTAVLVVAVGLFVLAALDRLPWPLLVYTGAVLVMALGTAGYYHSRARLLVPAFALLLPPAAGLAAARRRTVVVVVGLLAAASAWYGAYLCLLWRYSP
jgi:hypothetical protein